MGIKDGRILDMKRNLVGDYDMVGETVGFCKFGKKPVKIRRRS